MKQKLESEEVVSHVIEDNHLESELFKGDKTFKFKKTYWHYSLFYQFENDQNEVVVFNYCQTDSIVQVQEKAEKGSAIGINDLSRRIHSNNKSKGFYESEKNIGEMLCLIHSEVSEALEADRKGKYAKLDNYKHRINVGADSQIVFKEEIKDAFEDELADIMIRVMDLAAFKWIDLEAHIEAKMKYNATRPYKHGKKY